MFSVNYYSNTFLNHNKYRLNNSNISFKKSFLSDTKVSEQRDRAIIDYFDSKKENEKQLKALGFLTVISTLLALPAMLLMSKHSSHNSSKVCDGIEKSFLKFVSLKNDKNVPTLYECNSIDDKLKGLLLDQINFSKATPEDIKRAGMPKLANRFILFGAPGSGKSFFAKIFAKTLDADYKEVKYSDLNSRWIGEHLENISKCFEDVISEAQANPNKKYVLTFNEIDSLVLPIERTSSGNSAHSMFKVEERSVFLNYIDEVSEKAPNVIIIGTTNVSPKNNGLDGASMSRFMNILEVLYPNKECLSEALKKLIGEMEDGPKFISTHKAEIDEFSESLVKRKASFRNLNNIVNNSKSLYLKDTIKDKNTSFKMEYLTKARDSLDLMDGEMAGVA